MIVVYGRNERWLACDFESLNRKVIFCRWHCPRSGSMILRAQIVHINKGEGKPLLFRAILLFFYLLSTTSTPRRPYIHPSSTLHPPHIDLTSTPGGVRHDPQRFMDKTVTVPHFNRDAVEFASRKRNESNPGIKKLLPFPKNITEESDFENFQDLIVALDACYWLHKTISRSLSRFGDERAI